MNIEQLIEDASNARRIVGKLCSEGRYPKMSIPLQESDEDRVLCRVCEAVPELAAALAIAEERCRALSDTLLALVNESTNPTDDGSSFDACVAAARAALEGK